MPVFNSPVVLGKHHQAEASFAGFFLVLTLFSAVNCQLLCINRLKFSCEERLALDIVYLIKSL